MTTTRGRGGYSGRGYGGYGGRGTYQDRGTIAAVDGGKYYEENKINNKVNRHVGDQMEKINQRQKWKQEAPRDDREMNKRRRDEEDEDEEGGEN